MADYLKIAYMNSGGVYCVFCKSEDLHVSSIENAGMDARGEVKCNKCGKRWTDIYTLVDIELEEDEV